MYYSSASASFQPSVPVLLVLVILFLSLAAEFIPWPGFLLPVKPIFPMLALVYWAANQPRLVNYAAAVIIGVIMDLANQAPLGFNAMSCVVAVCMTNVFSNRFILLAGFAQALHVLIVLVAGQLCLYLLGFLEDASVQPPLNWRLFMPSMSSAALWLFLPMFVRYLRNVVFGGRGDAGY